MKIHDPSDRFTITISPKELKEALGIELKGEIVSIFMRKSRGREIPQDEQERIELKITKLDGDK